MRTGEDGVAGVRAGDVVGEAEEKVVAGTSIMQMIMERGMKRAAGMGSRAAVEGGGVWGAFGAARGAVGVTWTMHITQGSEEGVKKSIRKTWAVALVGEADRPCQLLLLTCQSLAFTPRFMMMLQQAAVHHPGVAAVVVAVQEGAAMDTKARLTMQVLVSGQAGAVVTVASAAAPMIHIHR